MMTYSEKESNLFHPYPNLPWQRPSIHWLREMGTGSSKCKHHGKVMNLGMFKTGLLPFLSPSLSRRTPARKCAKIACIIRKGRALFFCIGTKSTMVALKELGYECKGGWDNSCKYHRLHGWFPSNKDHDFFYLMIDTEFYVSMLLWNHPTRGTIQSLE